MTLVLKTGVFRRENRWELRKNAPNSRENSRIVFGGVVNLERIVPFRLCGAPVCFSTGNEIRGQVRRLDTAGNVCQERHAVCCIGRVSPQGRGFEGLVGILERNCDARFRKMAIKQV